MMKKFLLLGALFTLFSFQARSQSVSEVYAVFIYNFTKHVDNPVKTGDYKIAVLGDSKLVKELQKFNGAKTPSGQVISIVDAENPSDAANSRIVFLSSQKSSKIDELMGFCKSALIVTERSGMTAKGSCINFMQEGNKVGFEIGDESCKVQGVKISSKLQGLAKRG
jgi:hypothetical protein